MRKVIVALSLLALIGGVARMAGAAEGEVDMDLMQTIEDTNKSLASNIAVQNADASTKDAQELHQLFGTVESHYVKRGDAPDAVELARKSLDLTSSIVKSVGAKDFTAASESATALSRTCRACHTFYKKS